MEIAIVLPSMSVIVTGYSNTAKSVVPAPEKSAKTAVSFAETKFVVALSLSANVIAPIVVVPTLTTPTPTLNVFVAGVTDASYFK